MGSAKGWFQLRDGVDAAKAIAEAKIGGVRADGRRVLIDASGDDNSILGAVHALSSDAVAGNAVVESNGERRFVGANWVSDALDAPEAPAGGQRSGSLSGVCPEHVDQLVFSPDGALLAAGCCAGWAATVVVFRVSTREVVQRLQARDGESLLNQA